MIIERQATTSLVGTAVTANGNLFPNHAVDSGTAGIVKADGNNGALYLVIQKTGAGTASVTPQGNFDATWLTPTFYNIGYQRTDGQPTLTRATGAITLAGGTVAAVYQLLDGAPYMQFVVSAVSGSVSILSWLYMVPT